MITSPDPTIPDQDLEKKLSFLRSANTESMEHTDCNLLQHLLGTRQLLADSGARLAVCDAGLFHSVYSTQTFEQTAIPLSRRAEVRELIGEEAENLVWLFCMIRRETFNQNLDRTDGFKVQHRLTNEWLPLTKTQVQDLATMLIINNLEMIPRFSWRDKRICRAYLESLERAAIPGVQQAVAQDRPQWWELWK